MQKINSNFVSTYEPFENKGIQFNLFKIDQEEITINSKYGMISKICGNQRKAILAATELPNSKLIAVKKIRIESQHKVTLRSILKEIKLLRLLKQKGPCQNIMNINDIQRPSSKQEQKNLIITLEFMSTNLCSVMRNHQVMSQQICKYFLFEILKGLQFIHSANIAHRNLKPKNILINEDGVLKISGFKFARRMCQQFLNTDDLNCQQMDYSYIAPELLLEPKQYTKSVDLWSVGCIFGEMLKGKQIFKGQDRNHQLQQIIRCLGVETVDSVSSRISDEGMKTIKTILKMKKTNPLCQMFKDKSINALDLLEKLLKFNPDQRITASQALQHPFFSDIQDQKQCTQISELEKRQFQFLNHNLTSSQLRDLIYEETILYHDEAFQNLHNCKIRNQQSLISHILNNQIIDPNTDYDY